MVWLPANLEADSVYYMGGDLVSGAYVAPAAFSALAGSTLAALDTSVGVTANAATKDGWTRLSQQDWGFVPAAYNGPQVEVREQPGAHNAIYRQSLKVTDLNWSFTIEVNAQTRLIFGAVRQELRRFLVVPDGATTGSIVDQFVAMITCPTGNDGGAKIYEVAVLGHGPLSYITLT